MFITWVKFCDHGSSLEVARSTFVLVFLIVAVESVGGMVSHCVGIIARLVHLNLATISTTTSSTSPVKSPLQIIIQGLLDPNP